MMVIGSPFIVLSQPANGPHTPAASSLPSITSCTWRQGWFSGFRSALWLSVCSLRFAESPARASTWRMLEVWNTPILSFFKAGSSKPLMSMPRSLR